MWYQPENKHVRQALVANQIASICKGSSVCHEDDTLSKAKTDPVDVGSFFGRFIRALEFLLIRFHK